MRHILQRLHRLLLPLVLAGAFLASCNDNPTTIGSGYLPENVQFRSYTLKPEDFSISSAISTASNSSAEGGLGVLVGQSDDGVTAHGLLSVTSESQTLSGASAQPVSSAALSIRTIRYRAGDTGSHQLGFDVVVLDEVFASDTKWSDAFAARIESAPSLGTFNGNIPDSAFITVDLDPARTGQFLKEYFTYVDTTINGTTQRQFRTRKTLALRSRSDNKIVGAFLGVAGVSDSLRPSLKVKAGDSTVTLPIGATSWIARSNPDIGQGKFVVMAGVPVRTLVKLNLDSIPAEATIHQADLRLTLDPANSRIGTFGTPNFLAAFLAVDSSLAASSYLESNIGVLPINRVAGSDSTFTNVYRFTTLSSTINAWLRNRRGVSDLKNQGLIIAFNRSSSAANLETTTVDRLTFHGPTASDATLRPSLTIIYSVKVDANQ